MATPSSRPATPSVASTSNRRSSISSVASSGRRKDQSLLDVAASLGQRTPERSEPIDEGACTRSRQLDFDSIDGGDVDEEPRGEDNNLQEGGEVQTDEAEERSPIRPRRGRRVRVFWSTAEVECLRQGVEKYGVGNWKQILSAGQDVFLSHRTNVDLKDKWKNLSKNPIQKRPRSNTSNPLEGENAHGKRSKVRSDTTSEKSSPENATPKPRQRPAVRADPAVTNNEDDDVAAARADPGVTNSEDGDVAADSVTESVTLKFATDKSFPELVEISVDLNICKDVSALKEHLRSSILSDALPDSGIQIIGLESRVLFDDNEHLSRCIRQNGVDFFIVFEENPEEFV